MLDDENRELLARHGFTAEGVAAVEEFERKAAEARRARRVRPAKSPLDFGDWTP